MPSNRLRSALAAPRASVPSFKTKFIVATSSNGAWTISLSFRFPSLRITRKQWCGHRVHGLGWRFSKGPTRFLVSSGPKSHFIFNNCCLYFSDIHFSTKTFTICFSISPRKKGWNFGLTPRSSEPILPVFRSCWNQGKYWRQMWSLARVDMNW